MKGVTLHLLILLIVCGAVFFTNLGSAQLWDRDEPRNAGCAAEMMARGDWVVPIFNDELRHQKPVLLYWLIMSAYGLFGQSEFAARFWSALLACGTVLATYGITRRLMGSKTALLAGIILATNLMFDVAARAATPDSVLIFCGTAALWVYVVATFKSANEHSLGKANDSAGEHKPSIELRNPGCWFPKPLWAALAIYLLLGLGVLAKGPVGFLLPMAIIGLFGLIQRLPEVSEPFRETTPGQRSMQLSLLHWLVYWLTAPFKFAVQIFHPLHFLKTLWAMRPVTAAIVILLVAAPWYLLVHARTGGDFTEMFFLGEHLGRASTAMENHSGGLLFYPVAILLGFFPWSMFWGPVALSLVARKKAIGRIGAGECLAVCWIVVQVGAFSIAQTKLPSYVTPCYPALAILTAGCLTRWAARESRISDRWFYGAFAATIFSGVLIASGLGVASRLYFPDQLWILLIGLIPVFGGGLAVWFTLKENQQRALRCTVSAAALFCVTLFGFGTVAVDTAQQHQAVLNLVSAAPENQIVASYKSLESSWVFYSQRPIYESFPDGESDLQTLTRTQTWKAKPRPTPQALLGIHADALFITTDEHLAELKQRLPDDYAVVQRSKYFLRDREIVLLKRKSSRTDSNRTAESDTSANTDRR